jgi:hypothetical protein
MSVSAPPVNPDAVSFLDIGHLFVAKVLSYLPDISKISWIWEEYTKDLYEEVCY